MHHVATVVRITGAVTIDARFVLGIQCVTGGPMLVDAGAAPLAANRLIEAAAGASEFPNYPIVVPVVAGRQQIHVTGTTVAYVHIVEADL